MKSIWIKVCDYIMDHWLVGLGIFCFSAAFGVLAFPILSDAVFNALHIGLAGVLVALGANFLVQSKSRADKSEQRSRLYLDSCVSAYENAHKILKKDNDDPVNWVHAARMLLQAKNLEDGITEKSHRDVLSAHLLKYQIIFSEILFSQIGFFWTYALDPGNLEEVESHIRKIAIDDEEVPNRYVGGIPGEAVRVVCVVADWLERSEKKHDPLKDQYFTEEEAKTIFSYMKE